MPVQVYRAFKRTLNWNDGKCELIFRLVCAFTQILITVSYALYLQIAEWKLALALKKRGDCFPANFQAQENKTKIRIIHPHIFNLFEKKQFVERYFNGNLLQKFLLMWRLTSPNLRFFRLFVSEI